MLTASREKLDKLVETSFGLMEDENDETAQVGVAMLIVEVKVEEGATAFYTFCTDKREWIQKALVHEAGQAIEFAEIEGAEVDDGD